MTASPASNGVVTDDERLSWPDRKQAAERRGCSVTTIRNLEKRKLLVPVRVRGILRFDPDELEDADIDPADIKAADLIAAAVMLVKQSQDHVEKLVNLITVPSANLQATYDKINERQTARVEALETKNATMIDNAEKAVSLEHERHLEEMKVEASEKRKSIVFDQISKQIPDIVKETIKRIAGIGIGPTSKAAGPGAQEQGPAQTHQANPTPPSKPVEKSDTPKGPQVVPTPAAPTSPATPAVPIPPMDDDEASFQVHTVLAKLTDEQIDMMARAGFASPAQAHAFKQYRRRMEKDAEDEAIETAGESVPDSKKED